MSQSISSYPLSPTITKNPKTRTKELSYGNGYRAILVDGLNANEESWDVEFTILDSTAALALEAILLNSVTSSTNFISWTPPGASSSSYFTAQDIQKRPVGATYWVLSCTLRKEFLLG